MSVHVVSAVRIDGGRVVEAMCGRVDPAQNEYISIPIVRMAHEVASMIVGGDEVFSLFYLVDGKRVLGPKFRNVVYQGGVEGIVLADDIPGRGLADMVQLGAG